MDIDESDLINSNVFIPNPELNTDIPSDGIDQFKKFYETELQKKNNDKIIQSLDLKNLVIDDSSDTLNLLNTNAFTTNYNTDNTNNKFFRSTRDIITPINIDSRNRDKLKYPKPNHFKIFLSKTFINIKTIKLISIEFPNTNAVINNNNYSIYWRNKEDIDLDVTLNTNGVLDYPKYSNNLRIGSYVISTLESEIKNKLNIIRRKQGQSNDISTIGDFHYFVTTLDYETDIVTFISLTLKQLSNNPISTIIDSGIIRVFANNHGYTNNQNIYLVNVKTVGGIDASILNGFHRITIEGPDTFVFEVNVKASTTIGTSSIGGGGGNTVKSGVEAPFQLLWGQENNTIAQNIGFPLENSSQIMYTNINTQFETIYEMLITTSLPHGLSRDFIYIGNVLKIGTVINDIFILYKSYTIFDVPSTTTILVQTIDNTISESLLSITGNPISSANFIQFNNLTPIFVISYNTFNSQLFLITTTTPHGYDFIDINNTVFTLYNTTDPSIPNDTGYDNDYYISQIISPSQLIVPGILNNLNVHTSNLYGQTPKRNPLTSHTVIIDNIIPNFLFISGLYYTKIICATPHKLKINLDSSKNNDQVFFFNVSSTPSLITSITVSSIIDQFSFLIQFNMMSINLQSIIDKLAYISTGLITVNYPLHGFNSVVSITQHTTPGQALVYTINNHNLSIGNIIRISKTDAKTTGNVSMDSAYNIVDIPTLDSFVISKLSGPGITISIPGTTGIIGISNDFYLYGAQSVGGIQSNLINNNLHTVREIIDINTFTFMIPSIFATFTETGGGSNCYISSLYHGFSGIQTNTKNNLLNRSINLEGENYCFITCPQLDTMQNTGLIKNIFAKIVLDQAPGYVCFNYLSNPKQFNTVPLSSLSELEFSVVNYDDSKYEFFDLDYSFTLEITEVIDTTNLFNHSSRRGIIDSN